MPIKTAPKDTAPKDTEPKVEPKGPDLARKPIDIEALVNSILENVNGANKAGEPKCKGGRFDVYSEPLAEFDGQFSRKEDFVSLPKPITSKVDVDLGIDPKITMA